jgi:hypothetical protein
MVTPRENLVFTHYTVKYNLLKLGFSWTEIDNLHSKEIEMMMELYGAIATKERGFG